MTHETIEYVLDDRVARVTLARPDVRNAFDERVIAELTGVIEGLSRNQVRVLVLTGKGSAFCAGADLSWMRKMKDYSFAENLEDANALARMLRLLYDLPIPTIAAVNGPTIGGGNGLVAACDIAVASEAAVFSLSEVKIGLVPACIGPFVIRRIGRANAHELFLTGERIGAARAKEIGLVNDAVPADRLGARVQEYVDMLLTSGPQALAMSKSLVKAVPGMDLDEAGPYTAEMIARLRISKEAQEGMAAFFEKRPPKWVG